MSGLLDLSAPKPGGGEAPLSDLRGRVLLIVNTASRCGFTPQYEGLEALHREYGPRGLSVLAFPCNQFGRQEPGDAAEIANFCRTTYDVTFPVFGKIEVNGANAHPIFRHLKEAAPGALGTEAIKWNFTKFLVDRDGTVVARYAPATPPAKLRADIERLLGPSPA
ncbi:glutathione peroxidase [Muricoccus radiodurans]|uniref:glutathione peroxidase n=1 Tax=Muricoccus radiodurans TaxID=2231721 RepID=UPI003CF83C87